MRSQRMGGGKGGGLPPPLEGSVRMSPSGWARPEPRLAGWTRWRLPPEGGAAAPTNITSVARHQLRTLSALVGLETRRMSKPFLASGGVAL